MNIKFTRIVRSSPTVLPASNWQRSRWLIVATTLLLLFITIPAVWGANYHGRVIDAETGKPIEGAVIMVEWHKRANLLHGRGQDISQCEGNTDGC